MPCRYDPGPQDYARADRERANKYKADLDKLTLENDQLREALLKLINDPTYKLPKAVVKSVNANQVKHRKEDLARLEKTIRGLIKSGGGDDDVPGRGISYYEALGRVLTADPTKELEPQLWFNPDDI